MRLGGYFDRDYIVYYEEISEYNPVKKIRDPKPRSDQGTYSAMDPGPQTENLFPEGVGPWEWVKMYCFEEHTDKVERGMSSEDAWKTTGILSLMGPVGILSIPVVVIVANTDRPYTEVVRKCKYVVYNDYGAIVDEVIREVSRWKEYPESGGGGGDDWDPQSDAAADAFLDELREQKFIERQKELGNPDPYTPYHPGYTESDDIAGQEVDKKDYTFVDVDVYAADVTPHDDVNNYMLIKKETVMPGQFRELTGETLAVDKVYSGKELQRSVVGTALQLDPTKSYKIVAIEPLGSPRRYSKSYKTGIIPHSVYRVKAVIEM